MGTQTNKKALLVIVFTIIISFSFLQYVSKSPTWNQVFTVNAGFPAQPRFKAVADWNMVGNNSKNINLEVNDADKDNRRELANDHSEFTSNTATITKTKTKTKTTKTVTTMTTTAAMKATGAISNNKEKTTAELTKGSTERSKSLSDSISPNKEHGINKNGQGKFIKKEKTTKQDKKVVMEKKKEGDKEIKQWLQDVFKLHDKFRQKTSKSCDNRCVFHKTVCDAKTEKDWEKLLTSTQLKAVQLFPDEEAIFPWERDYLSHPPLEDIKRLPSQKNSRVSFINNTINNNIIPEDDNGSGQNDSGIDSTHTITCKINERLIFRTDLVDAYGNARKFGGDEVRAWITNAKKTLAMAGKVTDLGNGSYSVAVTPGWAGEVKLNIAVVYPREYLRAALYHMKEGRHRFIYGLFKGKNATEATICHTTPNIPGRPCVCNFTEWNRRPYYCGRPLDKRLSCKDWSGIHSASGPISKDYTPAEAAMAATMARSPDKSTIQHNLVIKSEDNDKPEPPLPSCVSLRNRSLTWTHESPRGMWRDRKEWTSRMCKEPPLMSSWVRQCLRSTGIWMIGDSNLDQLNRQLLTYVPFKIVTKPRVWSQHHVGYNQEYNITDTFRGHEYPLFHYILQRWTGLLEQGGVEDYFRSISSNTSDDVVIVIHYNLHFAISHLSAMLQRLVAVRMAIEELIERRRTDNNSNNNKFSRDDKILIAIRGPHISAVEWGRNHLFGGDVQAKFILILLKKVFEPLKDKIVFLDGWDMTIASENTKMHPPGTVPKAMLRTLLAFKCDQTRDL